MRLPRNMRRMTKTHTPIAGFSMIELMIVVAIIAVLAALAYPAYMQYTIKTNRKAAEACLSEHANYMERLYTTTLSYGQAPASSSTSGGTVPLATLPALDCDAPSQTGKNYSYGFGPNPASPTTTAYSIQATPISTLQQKDTTCGAVSLNQAGARGISGTGTSAQCW
jgi:type IV pilus assembly protein PilE